MAFRPCATCGKPFFGESSFTYVTWFDAEERFAFRLVQCRSCAADFRNPVLESADTRAGDVWESSSLGAAAVAPLATPLAQRKVKTA